MAYCFRQRPVFVTCWMPVSPLLFLGVEKHLSSSHQDRLQSHPVQKEEACETFQVVRLEG